CELAPVLINRTAVYRICQQVPLELKARGFDARSYALLANLDDHTRVHGWWGRRTFRLSERLLHWALRRPGRFLAAGAVIGRIFRRRRRGALPLIMDPMYLLFHRDLAHGVVVVYDTTPVTDPAWHSPAVGRLYRAATQILAQATCQVIACSQNTADHLRVNHGIAPSRLTVLP